MPNRVNSALAERRANKSAEADFQELFNLNNDSSSNKKKVVSLPISQLVDYPDQPFSPFTEERLAELAESINDNGLLFPIWVRRVSDSQYQILAGHNRKKACTLLGWEEIEAIVKDCDDDTAELIMLTSNLCQRQKLLPSEKAFAYKRQMDILRRQGKRTDLELDGTSTRIEHKLSAEKLAKAEGTSCEDIRKHIRLTLLIPELLDAVDKKIIPFTSGVDFSSITADNQKIVLAWLKSNNFSVSIKQSEKIARLWNEDKLTLEGLQKLFSPAPSLTPTQIQTFNISRKKWKEYDDVLPKDTAGFENLFRQFLEWLRMKKTD